MLKPKIKKFTDNLQGLLAPQRFIFGAGLFIICLGLILGFRLAGSSLINEIMPVSRAANDCNDPSNCYTTAGSCQCGLGISPTLTPQPDGSGVTCLRCQSSDLVIISRVQVSQLTSASAQITWQTNVLSDTRLRIKKSSEADYSPDITNTDVHSYATDHSMSVASLSPETLYDYQVTSCAWGSCQTSQERTFTTPSTSSDTTAPDIYNISVDAGYDNATVRFTTSKSALCKVVYALYPATPSTEVAESTYNTSHAIYLSSLTPNNQEYNYDIECTGQNHTTQKTKVFTFKTTSSPGDHVFYTGACTSPSGEIVMINQCSREGLYCVGGNLVPDCSQCGYTCPAGQTCRSGGATGASCVDDPSLSASPYDCNPESCYNPNGSLKIPAGPGCYGSWSACNANVIVKVKRDRVCNKWISCKFSEQTTTNGTVDTTCYQPTACSELSEGNQCAQPFENPAKDLTFKVPDDIYKIQNLTGAVIAGLDWYMQPNSPMITGFYPWDAMTQPGTPVDLTNGNFEEMSGNGEYSVIPWEKTVPSDCTNCDVSLEINEDKTNGNHYLTVIPTIPAGTSSSMAGARAPRDGFTTSAGGQYYAHLKIKAGGRQVADFYDTTHPPKVRVQFGDKVYTDFKTKDITLTEDWQDVSLGPITGMSGLTYFAVVYFSGSVTPFSIDDVSLQPVLKVSDETTIARSCRLYPQEDSPSCHYTDENGIEYRGWYGYCLEKDPKNPNVCLSWWPVDLISGAYGLNQEEDATYSGRYPEYVCMESTGSDKIHNAAPDNGVVWSSGCDSNSTIFCPGYYTPPEPSSWTFQVCQQESGGLHAYPVADHPAYQNIYMSNIEKIRFHLIGGYNSQDCGSMPTILEMPMQAGDVIDTGSSSGPFMFNVDDYGKPGWTRWKFYPDQQGNHLPFNDNLDNTSGVGDPCTLDHSGDGWGNNVAFYAVFDNNQKLQKFQICYDDDTPGQSGSTNTEASTWLIEVVTRDICSKFVKVVGDTPSDNKVWYNRIQSSSGFQLNLFNPSQAVCPVAQELCYKYANDFAPYGGMVTPDTQSGCIGGNDITKTDPTSWDSRCLLETGKQPLYAEGLNDASTDFSAPEYQARSGSPYACFGDCSKKVCIGGPKDGQTCTTYKGCCTLDSSGNCRSDLPSGDCMGVGSTAASGKGPQIVNLTCAAAGAFNDPACFGFYNLYMLFAKSYGAWYWDTTAGQYKPMNQSWTSPTNRCPGDARFDYVPQIGTAYQWSMAYCAIPPKVTSVVLANSDPGDPNTITLHNGGSVTLKVTTTVNAEQMPLNEIWIDPYGHGTSTDFLSVSKGGIKPRSSKDNPHTFTITYPAYDSNCTPKDANGACLYHPKVSIKDNWGWCSSDELTPGSSADGIACKSIQTWAPVSGCNASYITPACIGSTGSSLCVGGANSGKPCPNGNSDCPAESTPTCQSDNTCSGGTLKGQACGVITVKVTPP